MKVKIDADEWYPVYSVTDDCGTKCEVPEETVERWKRIEKEFDVMQDEMRAAREAADAERYA